MEQRTAIVTGAAGGIGLAVVKRFLADGHNVTLVDASQAGLDLAAARLPENASAIFCHADVTEPDAVNDAVARTIDRFNGIDILVNLAGGSGSTKVREIDAIDLATWDHVMDLNLRSTFLFCRAVVPPMRAGGFGRIINTSSVSARGEAGPITTVAGRLPYATAKAALVGFTAQLAKDVAEEGITVNAIVPGLILGEQGTRVRDRFDQLPEDARASMLRRYPMARAGQADEVAATVAFLASDAAGYVSGTAIPIDGAAT